MITNSQEYELFLSNIAQDITPSVLTMRVPTNESIYQIDWNTRKVEAPSFIGVTGDHVAEYIFFEMDRYYDMIDLADAIGLVLFKNANNEEYYQLIPYYDIESIRGKIIFPWAIQAPAALYSGTVSFSFKFFKIDPTSRKLIYELNTMAAKTKVLVGWANSNEEHSYNTLSPESIIIDNELLEKMNTIIRTARYQQLYWIDVDENTIDNIEEAYIGKHMLNAALPHVHGSYINGSFYNAENNRIEGVLSLIYIDDNTKNMYYYNGSFFVLIDPNN